MTTIEDLTAQQQFDGVAKVAASFSFTKPLSDKDLKEKKRLFIS
jgi:hypothetical protein